MNNLVTGFSSLLNALETVNQAEINMSRKMRGSLFKLGCYNRVFLAVSCGEFFLTKILQKSSQGPQKVPFFIKTSKWEKWWSWWLRMTNAFILCNLLWKVQKSLAANREGSFNILSKHSINMYVKVPLINGSQPEYYLKTDIHLNPGPVRTPCGVCYRPVAQNHRKMTCDGCFYDFHIKCGNLSPMEYTIYNQSENKQWNCNLCTDPFAFSNSFFMNSTLSSSYHSEMHNSLWAKMTYQTLMIIWTAQIVKENYMALGPCVPWEMNTEERWSLDIWT